MGEETDKKLYYHAFNRYTELLEQTQKGQQELEEMYLAAEEKSDEK